LAQEVSFRSRDKRPEEFEAWFSDLNKNLFPTQEKPIHEKLGGLMVIDFILDDLDETTVSGSFYEPVTKSLIETIQREQNEIFLEAATNTLGKLARVRSTSNFIAMNIENQLKSALELMQTPEKYRRLAAVLVLSVLAENAPSIFYIHVSLFIRNVWAVLTDMSKETHIRQAGCKALRNCLKVISERGGTDSTRHYEWFNSIHDEAVKNVGSNVPEIVHGSLLAIGELLNNSGSFMDDKYDKAANMILTKCAVPKSSNRGVALTLLPYLSKYSPELFCGKENYLDKVL